MSLLFLFSSEQLRFRYYVKSCEDWNLVWECKHKQTCFKLAKADRYWSRKLIFSDLARLGRFLVNKTSRCAIFIELLALHSV